jgi:hypothetical protein
MELACLCRILRREQATAMVGDIAPASNRKRCDAAHLPSPQGKPGSAGPPRRPIFRLTLKNGARQRCSG